MGSEMCIRDRCELGQGRDVLCIMNDMPSQALAQLVETTASTFTAFRNGYGLREYSLKMRYGLREYPLKMRYGFREYYLKP